MEEKYSCLQADDINTGMFITLLQPIINKIKGPVPPMGEIKTIDIEDPTLMGRAFEVMAIDLPYIAVRVVAEGKKSKTFPLDFRRVKLKKLNKEYVEVITDLNNKIDEDNKVDEIPENLRDVLIEKLDEMASLLGCDIDDDDDMDEDDDEDENYIDKVNREE
ncbi:MAG: hypothetical protein AABY32_04340 [Nanoarchaeota archaeon]